MTERSIEWQSVVPRRATKYVSGSTTYSSWRRMAGYLGDGRARSVAARGTGGAAEARRDIAGGVKRHREDTARGEMSERVTSRPRKRTTMRGGMLAGEDESEARQAVGTG